MITGKLYDRLKFLAQIVIPAVGTLYFALSQIWGLGSGEEVVGTLVAVDAFLGALLGVSQSNYDKDVVKGGELNVTETDEGKTFSLELNKHPDELAAKKEVHFKVVKKPKK